jgi:hypothetical protein
MLQDFGRLLLGLALCAPAPRAGSTEQHVVLEVLDRINVFQLSTYRLSAKDWDLVRQLMDSSQRPPVSLSAQLIDIYIYVCV